MINFSVQDVCVNLKRKSEEPQDKSQSKAKVPCLVPKFGGISKGYLDQIRAIREKEQLEKDKLGKVRTAFLRCHIFLCCLFLKCYLWPH